MEDEEFQRILNQAVELTGEDVENLRTSIHKLGMSIPISWEALFGNERKGHYEPVGVKWIQWVTWVIGLVVFKAWVGLEKALDKSRHFQGVSGYEWEDAEYLPFSQKGVWVTNDELDL